MFLLNTNKAITFPSEKMIATYIWLDFHYIDDKTSKLKLVNVQYFLLKTKAVLFVDNIYKALKDEPACKMIFYFKEHKLLNILLLILGLFSKK